jgi:hypothetical protein
MIHQGMKEVLVKMEPSEKQIKSKGEKTIDLLEEEVEMSVDLT